MVSWRYKKITILEDEKDVLSRAMISSYRDMQADFDGFVGCTSEGDKEFVGLISTGSGNILSWRLIINFFLRLFLHSLPSADSGRSAKE